MGKTLIPKPLILPYNCTNVELKPGLDLDERLILQTYNCTNVELKQL